jgi:spermidine/putrescine transport system ATP-binding protein
VANFLGVSNLVDAQLRASQNGQATVETHDGATLHVPSDRIGPHGSDAVRIGVRPEKVRLSPAGTDVSGNVLRGTVVVASFLGVSIQYVVRAAGGEELTVFAQNLDGAEPESLGPGREVQLSWDPQHTFVVAKEGS